MNTKAIMIISICALALLSTISGVTYSVFCDTETSHNNTMTVSTRYYNPVPGPIVLDANVSMIKRVHNNDNNPYGIFEYNSSNYRLFYNLEATIQNAAVNHTWLLIVWENETTFTRINSSVTDESEIPDKHIIMNGSYDFNRDLIANIYIIEDDYWNPDFMDVENASQSDYSHCLKSYGRINYYDTYKFEP